MIGSNAKQINAAVFLFLICATGLAQGLSSSPPDSSGEQFLGQVLSLLDQGSQREAEGLFEKYVKPLSAELDRVLQNIDRDFDEMGRQKARSDVLKEG